MSDDSSIAETDLNARVSDFLARVGKFWASPELKTRIARISEIVSKNPHREGFLAEPSKPLGSQLGSLANFISNAAMHGIFIGVWAEFELAMEILIMRLSGMTPVNTSIVCTPIQAGNKMQILLSLINENNSDDVGVSLLRNVQDAASRNIYVHGFWHAEGHIDNLALFYRQAQAEYNVKKRSKAWRDSMDHLIEFAEAIQKVNVHFNLTIEDISDYKISIVALEPIHTSRAEHRRQSKTNSRKANKTQSSRPPESSQGQ